MTNGSNAACLFLKMIVATESHEQSSWMYGL